MGYFLSVKERAVESMQAACEEELEKSTSHENGGVVSSLRWHSYKQLVWSKTMTVLLYLYFVRLSWQTQDMIQLLMPTIQQFLV